MLLNFQEFEEDEEEDEESLKAEGIPLAAATVSESDVFPSKPQDHDEQDYSKPSRLDNLRRETSGLQ